MKTRNALTTIITALITLPLSTPFVWAGTITDTYATGDTLTATQMNNIKNAVNDNDSNIDTNAINISINAADIAAISTPWTLSGSDVYYTGGDVGIGTTNPINPFHMVGNRLRIESLSNQAAGGITTVPTTDSGYTGLFWVTAADGSTYRANAHYDHTNRRIYVTNAGTANLTGVYLANGATSWTSTSDRRLKENIKDTTYGLDTILEIPVREYNFKDSDNMQKRIGLIAQEVYPVVPEVVTKGDEGEFTDSSTPWGVDIVGLTPILIKSIQELHQIIETQQREIEILKAKVGGM